MNINNYHHYESKFPYAKYFNDKLNEQAASIKFIGK